MKKKAKIAIVIWRDITSYWNWKDVGEALKEDFTKVISTGILLKKDTDKVILAQSLTDDNQVSEVLHIPMSNIIKYKECKIDG